MTLAGYIVPLAVSFLLGLFFTPLTIGMAGRWKICDKPNGRTSREIAHIGGVAIAAAVMFALIPVFLFLIPQSHIIRTFLPILIASGFVTFLLGLIDDLRSLHYLYKLFFQITVSVLVAAGGIGLMEHFGIIDMSLTMALTAFALASVWMLVVTTSFNLIDGIDGLASGAAVIAAASFAAAGYIFGQPLVVSLSLALMGAVLAFLRYNFPPARIFMGDSGSLFIGLLFGLISLLVILPGSAVFYRIAGCIIVLSVPLMDTALAFFRRIITGRPPFEADHMHLHHVLLYRLGSTRKVDFLLWSVSAVFGALGVLVMMGSALMLAGTAVIEIILFIAALRDMVSIEVPAEKIEEAINGCPPQSSRLPGSGE